MNQCMYTYSGGGADLPPEAAGCTRGRIQSCRPDAAHFAIIQRTARIYFEPGG